MDLSIKDFKNSIAFPCGENRQACLSLLKIPELKDVKVFSTEICSTLNKGSSLKAPKDNKHVRA